MTDQREEKTSATLKPCPLCGSAEFAAIKDFEGDCSNCHWGKWGRVVVCDASGADDKRRGCGASTGYCDTDAQAVEQWNRRALPSAIGDTVLEVIAAAREIPGMNIKAGAKLHPPRLVAALAALDAAGYEQCRSAPSTEGVNRPSSTTVEHDVTVSDGVGSAPSSTTRNTPSEGAVTLALATLANARLGKSWEDAKILALEIQRLAAPEPSSAARGDNLLRELVIACRMYDSTKEGAIKHYRDALNDAEAHLQSATGSRGDG